MKISCRLFTLSGPSGVGKSTLLNAWLEKNRNLKTVVSHTTRLPRSDEINGISYHFVAIDEFENMAASEEFADYRTIFGNYYGISKSEITIALNNGFSVVTDLDVYGALKLSDEMKNVTTIYLQCPDKNVLRQRIIERGKISLIELDRRMEQIEEDEKYMHKFDFRISLNSVEFGLRKLEDIYRVLIHDKDA